MTTLPNLADIPAALRTRPQWVVWRYEAREKDGKPTKVPYQAEWPKRKASSNAPRTWTTIEQAIASAHKHAFDGIGYVFSADDPFAGFDLDDMLDDDGRVAMWARPWLEALPTYTEISPSGHGVKGIVIGKLPGAGINAGIVELYDQGRYFTITGRRFDDAPAEPQIVNGALDRLYAFAQERKAQLDAEREQKRKRAYAEAALRDETARVRDASEGMRNDSLNRAAFSLAQFLESGLLTEDEIVDALNEAAGGVGLGPAEIRGTLRSGIRAGKNEPRAIPPSVNLVTGEIVTTQQAPITKPAEMVMPPSTPQDVNDLLALERKPTIWYAPGFLREGLGLLVGQPNVGKTPLAAQLAIAIATGGKWMGMVQTQQAKVLYLGMEYSAQELIPLFDISRCGQTIPRGQLLIKTIEDDFPTTAEEALSGLEWYIRALGIGVIIIDVLTAFLPPEKFKQNIYRGDYSELKPYHRLALQYNASILGVWHASKRESDPKLMYNGSTGMWAAAASRITMYQDQEQRVRIASFARMADKVDWALTQERHIAGRRWIVADATPEPSMGAQERQVYRWLKDNADKANPRSPSTIAEMTGLPHASVKTTIRRMFEKNLVSQSVGGGYFVDIADVTAVTPVTDVTFVTDVTSQHVVTSGNTIGNNDPAQQDALNNGGNKSNTVTQETHPIWSNVPPYKVSGLKVYLRSNIESDLIRAREICDECGVDYDAAYKAAREA